MSFLTRIYRITATTNLHVGSGKQSYGIIDNLVQRDAVSGRPVIHGSSLKGALREYFCHQLHDHAHSLITYVFGKDTTDRESQHENNQAGNYLFFDSHLLTLPVRSNERPFFRATSPSVLAEFQKSLQQSMLSLPTSQAKSLQQMINLQLAEACHFDASLTGQEVFLEDFDKAAKYEPSVEGEPLQAFTGSPLALLAHKSFTELCSDHHLPVIARNSLVDGRSENLWYEQIVPRQSVFFTKVMVPAKEQNHLEEFESYLLGEKSQLIQIGANASIGQGFCQFSPIEVEPLSQQNA